MRVLFLSSSYNVFGGTPKKTLSLMNYFGKDSALYVWTNNYTEFKYDFIKTGGKVYEGLFGRNFINHIRALLHIIDDNGINVVHCYFAMGEILGFLVKLFRRNVKVIISFENALNPKGVRRILLSFIYGKIDGFIYISEYVKSQKTNHFKKLKRKPYGVIYNGTEERKPETATNRLQDISLLDVAGLNKLKNLKVVIVALDILINQWNRKEVYFYVAGEGPERTNLEKLIRDLKLNDHVFLLGNRNDVGSLLFSSDIFVHPSHIEGFGIAVVEAMLAGKPIIVSNAGALPELIVDKESGLVIDPFDPRAWAEAIIQILDNKEYADFLAKNARSRAESIFSFEQFAKNSQSFYNQVLSE